MNKQAKIYVAGHTGLVGSAIVRQLKSDGFSNLLLCRSSGLDLRNQLAVDNFFNSEKPEYVFLAAAKVGGIHANDAYPAEFIKDNLLIQSNVIDAAYRHGAQKLLFLGSSCIYPRLAPQPLKEDYLLTGDLEPTNQWYAIAKIAGIKMCQAYRKQYGFNAISIMPTNLYGPGDNYDLENSHVLPALIRKFHLAKLVIDKNLVGITQNQNQYGKIPDDLIYMLALGRKGDGELYLTEEQPKVVLWGSGSPRREFLHVDDLANSSVFLMNNYNSDKVINVGVGEDIKIKELAQIIQSIVGFEGEVIWDTTKPDGTPRKLMDVTCLNDAGWKNTINLRNGIEGTYKNYCIQSSLF